MRFNPLRTIRYYSLKLIRLRGNPKSLALGIAVGVFIGISPTIPFHTVAIIGITLLMRASTLAALVAGTAVSNPLTMVPQYYLCWKVGNMLLPGRLDWERIQEVLGILADSGFLDSVRAITQLSSDAILVMLAGGLVLGLPPALAGYFFSYYFFRRIQLKRRQKHLLD
jgi:uncharacterized protein (DUF2062 family)